MGFSGNITKGGLLGPLKGKEISDLVTLMSNGSAYVNIHTDKYPKGAIRGQITTTVKSENGVTSFQTNDNATSTEQPSSMNNSASSQSENSTQQNIAFTNQSTSTPNLDVDASMK
jgi:CHRD domain